MEENYDQLKMEVITFEEEDIITASKEVTPTCENDYEVN